MTAPVQQFELFSGAQLRDKGIQSALDHANEVSEYWSDVAFSFLLSFLKNNRCEFMTENVREASVGIVPEPPSKRAWGGIMVRAKKDGRIVSRGFRNVSNSKAHCTPATVWIRA